jgi:hypothetical protein
MRRYRKKSVASASGEDFGKEECKRVKEGICSGAACTQEEVL